MQFLSNDEEELIENEEEDDVDDEEDDEDLCNSKPAWPSKSCSRAKDDEDEHGVISKFGDVDSNWDAIRVLV